MKGPAYRLTRCIVCGGAEVAGVADAADIRAEMEALWAFHGRRLRPNTPPERLVDRVAFSQPPPLRLVRCRGCGLVYRNPIERDSVLREAYGAGAPPRDTLAALHAAQRRAYRDQCTRLLKVGALREGLSGLEVGSYVGAFLAAARERGLAFEGVDVNPAVNAFARSLGFRVTDGAIDAVMRARAGRRFDVVAIWNTFDQLPEPRAAATAAWHLLAPGGVLALRIPNGGFYAALRRTAAGRGVWSRFARLLLAQNNLLGFPYRFGFTVRALAALLDDVGFEVVRVDADVLVPTADEWTRWWARLEERVCKALWRPMARRNVALAPWIEVYARKRRGP